ncbi:MAG: hypothetical protein ABI415_03505, partial [Flavitalea sp.]
MKWLLFALPALLLCTNASAIVKYDEGALFINGVTLLQDRENPKDYYYLPQYPRLSAKEDGTLEFLCIKYIGEKAEGNGGLFHALIEFSLPADLLKEITKQLQIISPGARIAGPVPLMQPKASEGDNVPPSFEIVSGILSNKEGKDAFTRSVITSGYAPLTPGSKAAVAALLNQQGATLLWNSFTGPTSDVSVSLHGYYEAAVKGYNAVVTADMTTLYEHFSEMIDVQSGYNKTQIRNIVDQLQQKGVLKVDVFDRSVGLGIKTSDMEAVLNLVTNKLTEIMFDTKTGWAKTPERVDPMLGFDPRGRQEKTGTGGVINDIAEGIATINGSLPILGWFSPKKEQNLNPQYVTDNQYVLKNVKDIRSNSFYLNLSKSTTIKVPLHTSGNLGGMYANNGTDEKYFRIVNMNDPSFQRRGITFQIDGEYVDAFDDLVNFVTVNFRKKYDSTQYDVTDQLIFSAADLKDGKSFKEISYPRLGMQKSDWLAYEYQLVWSIKGKAATIRFPMDEQQWISSSDPAISLVLPFKKEYIEVDADRQLFKSDSMSSANISFATSLGGDKKVVRNVILRQGDQSSVLKTAVYHDSGSPVVYQTKWYSPKGELTDQLKLISTNYLFLVPPPAS